MRIRLRVVYLTRLWQEIDYREHYNTLAMCYSVIYENWKMYYHQNATHESYAVTIMNEATETNTWLDQRTTAYLVQQAVQNKS